MLTESYHEPENIQELEALVAEAQRAGKPLRVVGSALSPNGLGFHPKGEWNISAQDNGNAQGDVYFVCEDMLSNQSACARAHPFSSPVAAVLDRAARAADHGRAAPLSQRGDLGVTHE